MLSTSAAAAADAGFAGVGFPALHRSTPMEVIMARVAGRTSIGNDDRRAELHVMEDPLGVRDVHADAAM